MRCSAVCYSLVVSVTAVLVVTFASAGAASPNPQLSGLPGQATVPGNSARWAAYEMPIGPAPYEEPITIAVHMALRNGAELKQVADEVSRPGGPMYGQYLTPAVLRREFAPDFADIEAVETLLRTAGMTDIAVGPANAYVRASATVAQLRKTFRISQNLYQHGAYRLRANRENPTIPAALAGKVLFIEGLDDSDALRTPMHRFAGPHMLAAPEGSADSHAGITPPPVANTLQFLYCDHYFGDLQATLSTKPGVFNQTLPWSICGYTPQQIRAAYGFDKTHFDGNGITVAIIDAFASPTLKADANAYATNHNLPPLTAKNFSQVLPEGIYIVPPDMVVDAYGWWEEQSLDVDAVHAAAPGAKIMYIGAKKNTDTTMTIALINTIYDRKADIISNSWIYNGAHNGEDNDGNPADVAMQNQAFMVAAAEGVTVLFISGDNGDLAAINGVASGSFEATSPYVTGVGGTSLLLTSSAGDKLEYGWSNYLDYLDSATVISATEVTTSGLKKTRVEGQTFDDFFFFGGSGGGISQIHRQPAYQAGIVPNDLAKTIHEASGAVVTLHQPHRMTPDVAMLADPITGYLFGETYTINQEPSANAGCVQTGATTEYCEQDIGGTSLSTPLMAGAIAVMDQARRTRGAALVGFANPLFYSLPTGIGAAYNSAAFNQITPPSSPTAMVAAFVNNAPFPPLIVSVNAVPKLIAKAPFEYEVCGKLICEGIDDVFNYVTPGYNDVTGLGVPFLPMLVQQ